MRGSPVPSKVCAEGEMEIVYDPSLAGSVQGGAGLPQRHLRGRVLVDLPGSRVCTQRQAVVVASRATGDLAWTTAGGSSTPVSEVQHRSE